jgi:hypothetical protein
MALVGLVYRFYYIWIAPLKPVRDFSRGVLRTIVHDDYLHAAASFDKPLDAI